MMRKMITSSNFKNREKHFSDKKLSKKQKPNNKNFYLKHLPESIQNKKMLYSKPT